MDSIFTNPTTLWFAFGAALIILEVLTVPGLGLFLAGLGAICTSILLEIGVIDAASIGIQFAVFFGATVLWTGALWAPLKKFRTKAKHKHTIELNNMVGTTAIVDKGGLRKGVAAQVLWSGTVMGAVLDASSSVDSLPEGAIVVIKSVSGITLTVTPK